MHDSEASDSAVESRAGEAGEQVERRDFLNKIAAAALGAAVVGAGVVTGEYLSPNVLFEPPASFRVGTPDDYPVDSVTYLADKEVYIVRTPMGFYAESAICTHLGCITQWKTELGLVACPCHGSRFKRDGTVVQGPAPRPLPHFAMRLMSDGSLQVDKLDIVPEGQILKA